MSDRETVLERLRDVHDFPGPYLFKVIGPNHAEFVTRVVQSVINACAPGTDPTVDTRESAQGNHLSVTVTVIATSAEHVLDIYDVLRALRDVRYVF